MTTHLSSWQQVIGDILMVICYLGPLWLVLSERSSEATPEGRLSGFCLLVLGFFGTIISHLISAGIIR